MAACFNEANSDTDALQTLIFMNPNYNNSNNNSSSSSSSFVFLNSSMSPATHSLLPTTTTEHTHHLVGIPLTTNHHHELISPECNLWTQIETSTAARETPRAQHGLSLSLSNSQQNPKLLQLTKSAISPSGSKVDITGTPSPASVISNSPISGMRSVLMSSKYLKATQQLLEEVVNVGSNTSTTDSTKKKDTKISKTPADTPPEATVGEVSAEISTAEKQEIQMKKGKLISILNELEQRYRQYNHQMQIVIVSFEQAAGEGSAKAYTALALRTISRQFRCIKDAIMTQMKAVNKALGEEGIGGGSRLKFVDHHLRQQCALQQLGMVQHNAWRPQRGLPERSVSVLRAWLFGNFLHPYPKDSDKLMLAKQTGLTRSQVSNWFINARVRLWKPMVEEMYNEEFKEQEKEGLADKMGNNGKASTSKSPTEENQKLSFKNASQKIYQNAAAKTDSISPTRLRSQQTAGFSLIGSSELEGIIQMSPKRQRINDQMLHHPQNLSGSFQSTMEMNSNNASNDHVLVKLGIESQPRDDYTLMAAGPANFIGGFGSYPMEEIGRFDTNQYTHPMFSGNGVSLTLGLTDTHHQSFLPNQSSAEWTLAKQLNSVP